MNSGVGKKSGVAAEPGALTEIIRFGVQLTFRFPQQRSDIQSSGQQSRDTQQGGDIIDVAVDTLADTRVLDFYGQAPPVPRLRQMDLAHRRCRLRREGELPEMTVPTMPPVGVEHIHQLAHWHGFGVGAQACQDNAKLRRQQIACIHGQQLPELHRCPA
jgi:hypothetical protein